MTTRARERDRERESGRGREKREEIEDRREKREGSEADSRIDVVQGVAGARNHLHVMLERHFVHVLVAHLAERFRVLSKRETGDIPFLTEHVHNTSPTHTHTHNMR